MNTFDCPHCGQSITAMPANNAGILSRFNMGQGELAGAGAQFRTIRTELRKADLTSDFLFPVFVGLASFFSLLVIVALYGSISNSGLNTLNTIFYALVGAFWIAGATLVYNQRGRFHEESEPIEVEAVTVQAMPTQVHTAEMIIRGEGSGITYVTAKVPANIITMKNIAYLINNPDFRFSKPYLNDKHGVISDRKYRQLRKFMLERGFLHQKRDKKNELTNGGKAFLRSYLRG